MFSFVQFISHSNKTSLHEATGQGIDATGKLFELHTMRHLAGGDHPRHYRDDNLGHPAAAAETLKGRVDQEEHDKVLNSSETAADRIREHIAKNHPGFKIHKVTWTSNKTDIQRFHEDNKTGGTQTEQDNADYIVSIKHPKTGEIRHIGISSKYSADPTARSPGIDALSNMAKANSDETRNIVRDHDKKISSVMGFTNQSSEAKSDIFRKITASGSKEELSKKREVDDISKSRGVTLAQHLHKSFSNIHSNNIAARNEHMKGVISTLSGAGGKNSINTIILGTDKKKVPSIKQTNINEKLDQMSSFHTKAINNHVHFFGIHRDTGEEIHLGKLELRTKSVRSSPHVPYQGFRPGSFLKPRKQS